ncbi:MAG: hypothetical protein HF307_19445 [Ignavibacteria bacterium]|jgi:Tfp pilus assembly protein PilN|nr:hypothetical protein [Ignavibacteria bacterium]
MRKVRLLREQIAELQARIEFLEEENKEQIRKRVLTVEQFGNILYSAIDTNKPVNNPKTKEAYAWLRYCKRKALFQQNTAERLNQLTQDIKSGIEPWQLAFGAMPDEEE